MVRLLDYALTGGILRLGEAQLPHRRGGISDAQPLRDAARKGFASIRRVAQMDRGLGGAARVRFVQSGDRGGGSQRGDDAAQQQKSERDEGLHGT